MTKKDFIKKRIEALIDFVDEKGNTMTIADVANVNETIDGIIERLDDDEEDFPSKEDVIYYLNNLRGVLRKAPYFNLVSIIFGGLNGIIGLYFK